MLGYGRGEALDDGRMAPPALDVTTFEGAEEMGVAGADQELLYEGTMAEVVMG